MVIIIPRKRETYMKGFKNIGIGFVLLIFIGGTGLGQLGDLELEQPSGDAFPEGDAGIAAYINTGQTIDIEEVKTIFSSVEQVGDNYIVGVVPIENWGGNIDVHLYADADGWLVAYLKKSEPASEIMQWSGDVDNPNIGVISSTTLEQALYKAGDTTGVGIVAGNIKYYDFEYPNANRMMIVAKTQATEGSSIHQLEIPADYMLFEASYYHFIRYYSYYYSSFWDSKLWVDGSIISDASTAHQGNEVYAWWRAFGDYKGAITPGTLHTITISYDKTSGHSQDGGSAGVATVLIYRAT